MGVTQLGGNLIGDEEVKREDLNSTTPGHAVIKKIILGSGLSMTSTGADPGTGDVTLSVNSVPGSAQEVYVQDTQPATVTGQPWVWWETETISGGIVNYHVFDGVL